MKRGSQSEANDKSAKVPNTQQTMQLSPVKIDTTAAMRIAKGNTTFYEKSLMTRNDIWHKIEVYRGASMDKELVLKSILQAVQPIDLIPVRYTISGKDSYFLIRNCDNALQQLCRLNLIIKTISGELLLLTITLGYASIHDLKMNIRPLLLALLTKRYQYGKKTLNLNSFHRDPDIINTVYCPLSLPRTLSSVLNIAAKDLSNFEKLSLRYNELGTLSGMETIKLNINSLDLRNNRLPNADCLSPLKDVKVTELWLDGNPLCENYSSPSRYVESIRKYFPNLTKLDGVFIGSPGLPMSFNNYVPQESRGELVNQFAKHFFTLYDARDRNMLRGIYHSKSVYSLTLDATFAASIKKPWSNKKKKGASASVNFNSSLEDSEKKIPHSYEQENRNLLFEKERTIGRLHYGPENILKALKKLPETQHYPETFSYNILFDSGRCFSFTVDGIFKDKTDEKFLFNRTFVLLPLDEDEYKILNDQLLIFCTSKKDLKLEEEVISKTYKVDLSLQLKCLSPNEKLKLIKQLKNITRIKDKFCQRFLEEADWNLRRAVVDFTLQYRAMCIPQDAFL